MLKEEFCLLVLQCFKNVTDNKNKYYFKYDKTNINENWIELLNGR